MGLLALVAKTEGWVLCRTRATTLGEDRLKSLLAWTKETKLPSQCKGKEVTGVEICGAGITQQVQDTIATTGLSMASKNIRVIPPEVTQAMGKAFFEVWKDEI